MNNTPNIPQVTRAILAGCAFFIFAHDIHSLRAEPPSAPSHSKAHVLLKNAPSILFQASPKNELFQDNNENDKKIIDSSPPTVTRYKLQKRARVALSIIKKDNENDYNIGKDEYLKRIREYNIEGLIWKVNVYSKAGQLLRTYIQPNWLEIPGGLKDFSKENYRNFFLPLYYYPSFYSMTKYHYENNLIKTSETSYFKNNSSSDDNTLQIPSHLKQNISMEKIACLSVQLIPMNPASFVKANTTEGNESYLANMKIIQERILP